MKLIKKSRKESQSFRTPHGPYNAVHKSGFLVVETDSPKAARYFMIRHKFVPAPAGFGEEKKAAEPPAPKPAPKPVKKPTKKPTKKATPKKK